MYLDRRSFDSYVPEIWLHAIKSKRKVVHFMSLATVKVGSGGCQGAGVDVEVILDKSQWTEKYSGATYLANHQIPVLIDDKHAIAHNKVMIIDHNTIITGSFNFIKAAEEKNAENVIVFQDNTKLAEIYTRNWRTQRSILLSIQDRA